LPLLASSRRRIVGGWSVVSDLLVLRGQGEQSWAGFRVKLFALKQPDGEGPCPSLLCRLFALTLAFGIAFSLVFFEVRHVIILLVVFLLVVIVSTFGIGRVVST